MRVLVTGGSGLVGRYVVEGLADRHDVEVLDIRPPQAKVPRFHRTDILDIDSLAKTITGYDAVVHLAGIPHPLNHPAETVYRVNTVGTFNVLEASARNGVPRFLFLSSESTLGSDEGAGFAVPGA